LGTPDFKSATAKEDLKSEKESLLLPAAGRGIGIEEHDGVDADVFSHLVD
jgi:hypothetical protein